MFKDRWRDQFLEEQDSFLRKAEQVSINCFGEWKWANSTAIDCFNKCIECFVEMDRLHFSLLVGEITEDEHKFGMEELGLELERNRSYWYDPGMKEFGVRDLNPNLARAISEVEWKLNPTLSEMSDIMVER